IKLEYKRNSITIIKEKEGYISKYNLTKNDGTNEYILTTNNNVLINKDGGIINSDDGSIKNNKERVNNPPTITERSPENNGSEIMRIINNFKKRVKEFDEIEKHKAQTEAKKKIETLEKQNTLAEADDLRNLENEIKYLA
ncbi:MAG TPA: hypothetical protein P5060_01685, partial [Candidatus Absconditabacterales bacterium]|nr:hypothetical protein [Candidatus Absconditabacterales bacterium]